MIAKKISIVVCGDTEDDVDDAFNEAIKRLKAGNTSGHDRGETSSFLFDTSDLLPTGVGDPS